MPAAQSQIKGLLLAMMLTLMSSYCFAQIQNGMITGFVEDPSQAILPNVEVTAINKETGARYRTRTTSAGEYTFPTLPIGTYSVAVQATGFKREVQSNLGLQIGQKRVVNFHLQLGQSVQTIQVTSAPPTLQTESASPGVVISNRYVQDLPLSIRNWDDLMGLAAGVKADRYTNQSGATSAGRTGGINIHGVRALQNNFILDGVDNNTISENVQELSTEAVRPSVDAIEEFKMVTDPYSAEFGRSPGGAIIVETKSGTNQMHGDLWEFNRTSSTDASDFFTNRAGAKKAPLTQNQFGGVIGGPIKKDKLFYFFNYEGTRISQGVTRLTGVPLANERIGDFSPAAAAANDVTYATIIDPTTGQPFSGNMIPSNRIDPEAAKLLALVPTANITPPPGPQNRENYLINPTLTDNSNDYLGRVDYQLNARNTFFGRYDNTHRTRVTPGYFGNSLVDGTSTSAWGNLGMNSEGDAFGWTSSVTSQLVNELRLGWFRNYSLGVQIPYHKSTMSGIGILGIPDNPYYDGGVPGLNFAGGGGVNMPYLGSPDYLPKSQFTNEYEVADTVNKMVANHQIKFGVDGHLFRNIFVDNQALRGSMTFTGQFTGNPLADYLLGYVAQSDESVLDRADQRLWMLSPWVEDSWKATRKLTLNLGLRYEHATWPYEARNQMANFDPATGKLVYASSGSGLSRQLVQPDNKDFAPRIGIAYELTPKTILRTGYGRFYELFDRFGSEDQLALNPPFLLQTSPQTTSTTMPLFLVQNGFPPDYRNPATFSLANSHVRAVNQEAVHPSVDQWNFGIQRLLPANMVLTVDYVGTNTTHLTYLSDLNQFDPLGSSTLPYPDFGYIEYTNDGGNSNYNGLEATLQKRLSVGLSFQAAYTYSRTFGFPPGDPLNGGGSLGLQDSQNVEAYYGLVDFSENHRFTLAYDYDLPFGKGRALNSSNRVASAILSGWQTSGIFTYHTGLPFTVGASANNRFVSYNASAYPNRVCNGSLPSSQQTVDRWFNPSCFVVPTPFAPGNEGSNILTGPSFTTLDFGMLRSFPFGEERRLEFRWEAFNLANTPLFGLPNRDASNPGSNGRITSLAGDPRVMQFALKLYF
jgi:Carboxypeptidase regulatory-like domain/TonB-dependent Receptor Plug Domain